MRSFKSKVLSAAAWAVPALAAVLPPDHHRSVPQIDARSSILDFDLQNDYAQATFSVPCAGCLGQDSDDESSLVLNFKTHASEQACGTTSNITLNGIYLPQEWNGDIASGSGSFSGIPDIEENAWFLQHDLDLEWESACLHGENKTATEEEDQSNDAAQVFTVTIKGIDGKPIRKPAGFTISFKQLSPPELLRLEVVPNHDAIKKDHGEEWREPPARLRLILPSDEKIELSDIPNQLSIEDDIRELRALQAEVHKLHGVIKTKQEHINRKLKKEAHNFKEELQQCDSIACVVKIIAHKAHGAWRVLYIRFRPIHHHHHPPPPPHHGPPMGHEDEYAHVWRAGNHKQAPEAAIHVESLPPPPPPPHGFPQPPPPPPPHGPHGFHHGPPPPHGHHGPPPSPLIITLKVIVGVLCCGCLFTVIRHKCSSLRTRTERAAAREERRNARAYRRAARRHAWTKWWSRNRRDEERRTDYEEKRALIQEQESVLEEAMQEEIRQLRAAHGVVNSLVTAEEGRSHSCCSAYMRCHCHAHPPTQAPYSPVSSASIYTSSSLAELPSRPLSRTNSLPEYMSDTSSAPPAYVEDEDTSDVVANGFRQYTPSTTSSSSSSSSRWTPDSSVIDVSPRPSAETLRYAEVADTSQFAETTETGVGSDTKN